MPKAKWNESKTSVGIHCPACDETHWFQVNSGVPGHNWTFNGDLEKPTFSPSMLYRTGHFIDGNKQCWCTYEERFGEKSPCDCVCCHSFVTDGMIQFLGDCSHAMAGQTVPLGEI